MDFLNSPLYQNLLNGELPSLPFYWEVDNLLIFMVGLVLALIVVLYIYKNFL